MSTLQGHLLVASPYLEDPNFVQTVVLLIQHSEEGAFGIVLNRAGDKSVRQLWEEVGEPECAFEGPIHLGGPVEGPVMAIHGTAELGDMEVVPGVFFSAQKENLEKLVRENEPRLKIFAGYSGWGKGQLEAELEQGAWLSTPATADYVLHADESGLWKQVARDIGEAMLQQALRLKHVPDDPSVN